MNKFLESVRDVAARMSRLCEEPVLLEVDPPATERQVSAVESELGYALPPSLRAFFLTCSARVLLNWFFEWEFSSNLPEPLRDVRGGSIFLSLQEQEGWQYNWRGWEETGIDSAVSPDQRTIYRFADLHPFVQAGNGDTLLLVMCGANEGEVLLQAFEATDMRCTRLARTFEEFLDLWGNLGYAGPDESDLRPFYDPQANMLSLSRPAAIDWRRICGLDVDS